MLQVMSIYFGDTCGLLNFSFNMLFSFCISMIKSSDLHQDNNEIYVHQVQAEK